MNFTGIIIIISSSIFTIIIIIIVVVMLIPTAAGEALNPEPQDVIKPELFSAHPDLLPVAAISAGGALLCGHFGRLRGQDVGGIMS